MDVEVTAVRLLLTIPAALGALAALWLFTVLLRIREPRIRAALALIGMADVLLTLFGLSSISLLVLRLSVDPATLTRMAAPVAGPTLAFVILVGVGLAARRVVRHRRISGSLLALSLLDPAPEEVASEVGGAAGSAGVAPPRVFLSPEERAPFLVGRVLVLPLSGWSRLAASERRATLLHEMAHLRRRDVTRWLVLGLLSDLFWFNPAFRRLVSAYGCECEALADRLALRWGAGTRALAAGLATLAAPGRGPAIAPALGVESCASIRRRLRLLLARPRRRALLAQVLLLALVFPVAPPGLGGCRLLVGPRPEGERGRVMIGLGLTANPLSSRLLTGMFPMP